MLVSALRGDQFLGGEKSDAFAGVLSYVQFLNPAGSGRLVILERVVGIVTVATKVTFARHDAALIQLSTKTANKDVAGAAPLAQVRWQNNIGAPIGTTIVLVNASANLPVELLGRGDEPIALSAGKGLIVGAFNVNEAVSAMFHWREVVVL